jgi:hypothetical protein
MCVAVSLFEAGFVHVSVGVLGSVVVGVGVLVLDVLVFVRGVRVRVSNPAVLVLVRMRPSMGVLFGHRQSSPLCEKLCLASFLDNPQPVVDAVMPRDPGTGVLGVVNGVDNKLSDVVVLQAVEDRRTLPTGSHQASHPQLGEVLRHRWCGFAHMLGEFIDRHLALGERPQHLDAGGVGQHPEHLDNQADLIVRQPSILVTCIHTQIIAQGISRRPGPAASEAITR